jgi:hypothetical protein
METIPETRLSRGRPKVPPEILAERALLRKQKKDEERKIRKAANKENRRFGNEEPLPERQVFDFDDKLSIKKSGKFGMRFLWDEYQEIRAALEKLKMTWQESFDYLIVSGIVYIKPDLVNLVRAKYPSFVREQDAMKKSRLSSSIRGKEIQDRTIATFLAFKSDLYALDRWCIEENKKKSWVVHILFRELIALNPILLNHIERCKDLRIRDRKKNVARLMNDEYIESLDESDSSVILSYLTKRYNERKFGNTFIEEEIINLKNLIVEKEEIETIDTQLNRRIASQRQRKTIEREKHVLPLDEEENVDTIDEQDEESEED